MLLQTNSYIVPKDRRSEHTRLLRKFRSTLARLGCDQFEVYEQVGANWATGEATGRFVQIMRFRDRKHQQDVQAAERQDPVAQQVIQEFCALINFPYQQQQGLFAVGFYNSALPVGLGGPRVAGRQTQAPARGAAAGGTSGSGLSAAAGAAAAGAGIAAAAAAPEISSPEGLDLPASATGESAGSSLLDFTGLAPAAQAPPPLRLADDAGDEVIESEVPAVVDAGAPLPPELPGPVEDADNGEHTGSFSDEPEAMLDLVDDTAEIAGDDLISDADRESVLGELTGDDARDDEPPQDDDAQTKSRAR